MALELNGTTGVSAVQAGAVESGDLASGAIGSGDLPAGSVIQVVESIYTGGSVFSNSTSYVNPINLTATITPISTSSKILIQVHFSFVQDDSNGAGAFCGVKRNGSLIFDEFWGKDETYGQATHTVNICRLDNPSSTSSLSYEPVVKTTNSNGDFRLNPKTSGKEAEQGNGFTNILLMEIAG